jgi:hypothetical protein
VTLRDPCVPIVGAVRKYGQRDPETRRGGVSSADVDLHFRSSHCETVCEKSRIYLVGSPVSLQAARFLVSPAESTTSKRMVSGNHSLCLRMANGTPLRPKTEGMRSVSFFAISRNRSPIRLTTVRADIRCLAPGRAVVVISSRAVRLGQPQCPVTR